MNTNNNLPSATDIETKILASIINDPSCFMEVNSILTSNHFYSDSNHTIFENLVEMDLEGVPIDSITLYEWLKKKKVINDAALIARISSEVSSSSNVKYYSRIVLEKFVLRQMIFNCRRIEQRAINSNESDVFEFLSEAEGSFNKINADIDFVDERKELPLGEVVHDAVAEIRKERDSNQRNIGMAFTTFTTLNKHVGGLMPGDLVGIYGREKSSKSTLAFSLVLDLGMQGIPGAYFSYEMQQSELIKKSLSLQSGVDYNKMRNPKGHSSDTRITDEDLKKLEAAADQLKNNNLIILDDPLNEYQIAAKLKQFIKRNQVKVAVIDYLMLVNSAEHFTKSYEELNHLSKFFKRLAMQLKIAIIVVSQSDYGGERTAQGLGLQRDSNYFFYIERKAAGSSMKFFNSSTNQEYAYTFGQDQFLVTLRGSRHSVSNRSFVVQYINHQYNEVDTSRSTVVAKKGADAITIKKKKLSHGQLSFTPN